MKINSGTINEDHASTLLRIRLKITLLTHWRYCSLALSHRYIACDWKPSHVAVDSLQLCFVMAVMACQLTSLCYCVGYVSWPVWVIMSEISADQCRLLCQRCQLMTSAGCCVGVSWPLWIAVAVVVVVVCIVSWPVWVIVSEMYVFVRDSRWLVYIIVSEMSTDQCRLLCQRCQLMTSVGCCVGFSWPVWIVVWGMSVDQWGLLCVSYQLTSMGCCCCCCLCNVSWPVWVVVWVMSVDHCGLLSVWCQLTSVSCCVIDVSWAAMVIL